MAKGKLAKDRQHKGQRETDKSQTKIMTEGKLTKDRQYDGQREIEKTDTIMAKGKLSASFWP
jgi:hypothetical protein